MCGIAGIIAADTSLVTDHRLRLMTDILAHRGPDGQQRWISPDGQAGLGHRRLSILDLSESAAQPMHYLDRYTIIHNGEIYNYIELRATLTSKGYRFRTSSDTEVILAAFDFYGTECPTKFEGMFAFAIWDQQEKTLFAARDRFGEKPFCYSVRNKSLVFGSEAKAIRVVNGEHHPDEAKILNFLTLGHTRNGSRPQETIYRDIFELPPASYLTYQPADDKLKITKYWTLSSDVDEGMTDKRAIEDFSNLFEDSVSRRLRSDVAIGCSLSGGLDSSSIVAAIAGSGADVPKTFSAVFPGFEKDESSFVNLMKQQYGFENYQVIPTAEGLANDLRQLVYHQETFISSASIYAQYCVFRLAKAQGTTVLLDGQGADEILAGYSSHLHWALQEMFRRNDPDFKQSLEHTRNNHPGFSWTIRNKLAARLPALTAGALKKRELRKIKNAGFMAPGFANAYSTKHDLPEKPVIKNLNDILLYHTTQYGLNELLHYADRNSMAHGREVRLPFLDHQLVEFIFSLPLRFKFRDGWSKWLLRTAMSPALPAPVAWRKDKVGFEPPQQNWMQHESIVEQIFESKRSLVNKGILNTGVLTKKNQPLDSHAADNFDWRFLVTDTLIQQ